MAERRAYEELNRAMMKNSSISPRRSRSGSPARASHRRRSRSGSRHRRSFSRSKSRSPAGRRYGGGGGGGGRKHYSRSRSGSRDRGYGRGGRSRSRSPMSSRRRHQGNRDNPEPNKCLGVFGLSLRTTERDLREVFSRYGPIEECNVVVDAQTGRSRGFAFIYFDSEEDSKAAKEACNGIEIDGRRIRVDFSITRRAHTPTPGIYMGKPTEKRNNRRRGGRDDYRSHRRSPSPQYNRRRSRHSRSRSYSPRRYY